MAEVINPDKPEAQGQDLTAREVAKRLRESRVAPAETGASQPPTYKLQISEEEIERMGEAALFGPRSQDS